MKNIQNRPLSLEVVQPDQNASFRFINNQLPNFNFPWHYHPELEISLVTKGHGMRIVGDYIQEFTEGDLCFFGPNIPHTWYSKPVPYQSVSSLVIQFSEGFIQQLSEVLPEFQNIQALITAARRGLSIEGHHKQTISQLILKIQDTPSNSPIRTSYLIHILSLLLSHEDEWKPLATVGYTPPLIRNKDQRITAICKMIHENLTTPYTQSWVSQQVGLSPASFSRFFKKTFGKSYIEYINELRISYACRVLIEQPHLSIIEVAQSVGFNNMTNFNRLFKRFKKTSPKRFRNQLNGFTEPTEKKPLV